MLSVMFCMFEHFPMLFALICFVWFLFDSNSFQFCFQPYNFVNVMCFVFFKVLYQYKFKIAETKRSSLKKGFASTKMNAIKGKTNFVGIKHKSIKMSTQVYKTKANSMFDTKCIYFANSIYYFSDKTSQIITFFSEEREGSALVSQYCYSRQSERRSKMVHLEGTPPAMVNKPPIGPS